MTKLDFYSNFRYHTLVATINFKAKDDSDDQKRADVLDMIEVIARGLHARGLPDFFLSSGRVFGKNSQYESWTLFSYFGNEKRGIDLQTRTDAREVVLSAIRASHPTAEKPVQDILYMPNALIDRYLEKELEWETRFEMYDGKPFVFKRDGFYVQGEKERRELAQNAKELGTLGRMSRAVSKFVPGGKKQEKGEGKGKGTANEDMTLDQAILRVQKKYLTPEEEALAQALAREFEVVLDYLQELADEERRTEDLMREVTRQNKIVRQAVVDKIKERSEEMMEQQIERWSEVLIRYRETIEDENHKKAMIPLIEESLQMGRELWQGNTQEEEKEELKYRYIECMHKIKNEIEQAHRRRYAETA
ncbi:hypothetical protein BDV06DRAFT_219181 [Aspergillus oleicola]